MDVDFHTHLYDFRALQIRIVIYAALMVYIAAGIYANENIFKT